MRVGFIGLGIMGLPMAGHIAAAGHTLFAHSRSGVPPRLLDAGATASASPAEVARHADAIILMLPDTPDVEAVLFGTDGVADGLAAGRMVIDMSSISPLATREFAQRIEAASCAFVDAPVSGGEVGAQSGNLTIMAGGTDDGFARAEPLLRLMGRTITHVGPCGAGQTAKVANQIIVALTIEAVAEALVFAAKAGADPARVREALMGGFASSRVLEVHGQRMIDRSFEPGFRIGLHQKDLELALSGARQLGVILPNTASCQSLFNACIAAGGRDWDHSALVRALERLAAHELS
jgi:2-hydroxy-3-oxopropionate reductase